MNKNLMAEFWYRLVTPRKRHCLVKLTLYVHICHVCDGLYASWRVKATRLTVLKRSIENHAHEANPT